MLEDPPQEPLAEVVATDPLMDSFEHFYACYPRKQSKPAGAKAWIKLNPDDKLNEEIIWSLREQIRSKNRQKKLNSMLHTSKQKLIYDWPLPATWINGMRWLDELPSSDEIAEKFKEEKKCACGKTAFIQKDEWLCCRCYDKKYNTQHSIDLYEKLKKMGLGKLKDETLHEYSLRCRKHGSGLIKTVLANMVVKR